MKKKTTPRCIECKKKIKELPEYFINGPILCLDQVKEFYNGLVCPDCYAKKPFRLCSRCHKSYFLDDVDLSSEAKRLGLCPKCYKKFINGELSVQETAHFLHKHFNALLTKYSRAIRPFVIKVEYDDWTPKDVKEFVKIVQKFNDIFDKFDDILWLLKTKNAETMDNLSELDCIALNSNLTN